MSFELNFYFLPFSPVSFCFYHLSFLSISSNLYSRPVVQVFPCFFYPLKREYHFYTVVAGISSLHRRLRLPLSCAVSRPPGFHIRINSMIQPTCLPFSKSGQKRISLSVCLSPPVHSTRRAAWHQKRTFIISRGNISSSKK